MAKTRDSDRFAGIEYHGVPGSTSDCLKAIIRLIHFGDIIERALIVSSDSRHAFLLYLPVNNVIAIKSGFGSNYRGQGSLGFSKALLLLERHCEETDEVEVGEEIFNRLERSCLLRSDLELIESQKVVRPSQVYDYIFEEHCFDGDGPSLEELIEQVESDSRERPLEDSEKDAFINRMFPTSIPYGLLDSRLIDLAFEFRNRPDVAIFSAFRRLESIVRRRIGGSNESGSALMTNAFLRKNAPLKWSGVEGGEQEGRASLFPAAYKAFRNRRAHKEVISEPSELLREFLIVNELYLLERSAVDVQTEENNLSRV